MISEQPVRGSFASNVQYGLRNAADGTRRVCREQLVYLVGMLSKPTLLGSALISFAKPARSGSRVQEAARLGLQSKQYSFSLDNLSEAGKIFQGMSTAKGRDHPHRRRGDARGRAADHRGGAPGGVLPGPGPGADRTFPGDR